ncbi:MAG: hypothetical protein AVDCRST_MAG56-871 [uncultured Cytophagales bacterium]|uniref:Putative auto-transporter adhesin head GIN domain-containing protein n=1 Tax=uncultured Cytophagales bacterium TaxID=158755 RepID=A0A6J4HRM9_9SPHI|nr:MAG: hypothetical protein AVDCRST_MAG56-871 [uncultured Cytophagales bacterium]
MKTIQTHFLRKSFFTGLTLAALGLSACDNDDVIRGRGDVVTQTRAVGPFSDVEIGGDFEVYLRQGPAEAIRLEGQENVLDVVTAKVEGQELEIKFKPFANVRKHKTIRVYITNPTLTGLELSGSSRAEGQTPWTVDNLSLKVSGSGSLELEMREANEVESRISGSGSMSLRGDAEDFENEISGSGNVRAFDLVTRRADTKISGSGNCELTVTQSLNARISGSGDVRYKGDPTVNVSVSGSGKVTRVN